jgi:YVTN family beta-propeller protein
MKSFAFLFCSFFLLSVCFSGAFGQGPSGYHIISTFKIASPGGWDYISVGPNGRIFASHGGQVNVLDEKTGDSVGVIPNTTGVHGIAFDLSGNGYTSNGRLNTVTVFSLKNNEVLAQIATGQNPDAIMYEPFTKKIITCNGRSHDLSVIDPATRQVTSTITVSGKPETAVSDGAGKIFVNIEDKSQIDEVDMQTGKVIGSWSLAPAEGPTGLAIDLKTKRLFAGCDKLLVVMDAQDGHIVDKLPIADGCDGVAFDSGLHYVLASCGEGKVTVIEEKNAGSFAVLDNVVTKRSARTIAVDEKNHKVFLPAADMEAAPAGERPRMIPGTFQIVVLGR